jgi:hypothetical protein
MQTATRSKSKRLSLQDFEALAKRRTRFRQLLLATSFVMLIGAYFSSTPQRAIALTGVGILGGLTSQRRL